MKLKRLLLRHEPPGVGLECSRKDGELDVRHKDLPDKENVHNPEDIYKLVEDLLISEPELLTRSKHQRALLQLLGRLYSQEVPLPPEPEKVEKPKRKKDKTMAAAPAAQPSAEDGAVAPTQEGQLPDDGALAERAYQKPPAGEDEEGHDESQARPVGTRVVLVGLKSKHAPHNGSLATVTKVDGGRRYEVETSEGESVKIKGSHHLIPLAEDPRAFGVGAQVAICGLRNHAALNGQLCRVIEYNEQSQRHEVRSIDSGQLFRVKPENIVATVTDDSSGAALAAVAGLGLGAPAAPAPARFGGGGSTNPVSAPSAAPGPVASEPVTPVSPDKPAAPKSAVAGADAASATAGVPRANTSGIEEGSIIQLVGLKNAAWLNGEKADVIAVDLERHRYEIRLHVDNSVKKVRAENCQLFAAAGAVSNEGGGVAPPKATSNGSEARPGGNDPLKRGAIVSLIGLRSTPQLNGEKAEILKHDVATDRYEIRLEMDNSVKKVRRENLELCTDANP